MIIDKVTLGDRTQVSIDAEGIRVQHSDESEVFLTFDELRNINALVEALGRDAHHQALLSKYASPLFGEPV